MKRLPGYLAAGFMALLVGLLPGPAAAFNLIRDAEIERTLSRMTRPIFQAAGLDPKSIHIYIVDNPELNAFVAGGNNIFVNSGLLMTLKTPEELLGVLAHETGHIANGDEAQRALAMRGARGPALLGILAGIAAAVAGGPAAGMALSAGSQSVLIRNMLAHTRAQEATADQAAVKYLVRAGIDPAGLRKVMQRFRGEEVLSIGQVDPYIQTHPLSTERMELIDREVTQADATHTFKPDPEREYWHGRMRAKLRGFLQNPERVLRSLADKPPTEDTLYAKAVALYRKPDLKAALATIDKLIAMRPHDPFYNELKGQILFETGHAAEAVPLYRKAVSYAPKQPLIQDGLGRALLALNQPAADAEALKVLKQARASDLGDPAALRDLATAYSRAGQDGMAALATAERYAMTGHKKDAVVIAKRAAAVLPRGSPGWLRAQDILALDPGKDKSD